MGKLIPHTPRSPLPTVCNRPHFGRLRCMLVVPKAVEEVEAILVRQAIRALLIFLLLPVVAFSVLAFPHLEFRRFIEPPSMNPHLTDRVLAVIDSNSDFDGGQFIVEVSQEVCRWDALEELRELATQPGWQLTTKVNHDISFKKNSFWPWDRHGLVVSYPTDRPCYAAVHRADTI